MLILLFSWLYRVDGLRWGVHDLHSIALQVRRVLPWRNLSKILIELRVDQMWPRLDYGALGEYLLLLPLKPSCWLGADGDFFLLFEIGNLTLVIN